MNSPQTSTAPNVDPNLKLDLGLKRSVALAALRWHHELSEKLVANRMNQAHKLANEARFLLNS